MERRVRHSLIVLGLLLLSLPAAQQLLGLVRETPLQSREAPARQPQFSVANWLAGTLQDSLLPYTTEQIGFQPTMVRLNNQIHYSLYNTAQANRVAIGKDGALYDPAQIRSALGMDYAGAPFLLDKLAKFSALQTLLAKKGIKLAMVVVPGKGLGLPESIPDGYPPAGPITNHVALARLADSLHLPLLDLVHWYTATRKKTEYPMYASTGNHWSEYCGTLAADTLFGYLQSLTQTELNRLLIKRVNYPIPASPIDNDLNAGMNLLFSPKAPDMAYPVVDYTGKPRKLRVLSIGDSFYFKLFTDFSGQVFEQSHFWFYFRELHRLGEQNILLNAQVDLRAEIESQDVILLYMVDSHVRDLGFGFVEAALAAFNDRDWATAEIARISADIRKDANWMGQIAAKAQAAGVTPEEMLLKDAVWVLENTRVTQVPH